MSMISYGNACITKQRSESEHRLWKEQIAERREKNKSASRLRKQAYVMHDKSLDDYVSGLYLLSKYKNSYIPTSSGKTAIEIMFDKVKGFLEQSLEKVERKGYSELYETFLYLLKEASTICDMIHWHSNPNGRYEWGSKRIENFIHSYNLKIKGDYLH